ncbi:Carbamate kinase [Halalkaliarchaeum sp. AArc-CO]|uniref:carbamate kinase n=1 Tax=unclassified Halalkaliarchaeum TaxID=2678344 RepID=UPI00217E74ED|nr:MULTISPECIES: carbamate kinase [unclassified Halalkaliarchaeum]MDR5671983.1 carbamate kinase [Halalkaliarchaeum sp. AArc-GB]UWG51488.1 Carbamate kinase [Halalkaliarchaeum sp. AArc-CO]
MSHIVVALGGNAILEGGKGTIAEQRRRVRQTVSQIGKLGDRGYDLIVTHGNGPQVGQLLLQNEESQSIDRKPLDVLVAESQAQIGYLLQQELHNVLETTPVTLVTRTLVDDDDPAFENPTKRIGPFYGETEAERKEFPTRPDTDGAGNVRYRRVVPSPAPLEILETEHVETLLETGRPVVCVGGGGVPVVKTTDGFAGVEAVVDKDLASRTLANDIGIGELLFLTDVEAAYRNFGTEDQELLSRITAEEAAELLEAGEFGEGSMAPKVEAAIAFVENGGSRAIITATTAVTEALDGETGTTIVPSSDSG